MIEAVGVWWSGLSWTKIATAAGITAGAAVSIPTAWSYWDLPFFVTNHWVLAQEKPTQDTVRQIYNFQRADWIDRKQKELEAVTAEIRDGEVKILEMKDPTAKELQAKILGDARTKHDRLERELQDLRGDRHLP